MRKRIKAMIRGFKLALQVVLKELGADTKPVNTQQPTEPTEPATPGEQPIDALATTETVSLYQFLFSLAGEKMLFGKQDELLVGANHLRGTGGSDTFDMIQNYPAMYGFDLGNYEQGMTKNKSNLYFSDIRAKMIQIYNNGGVLTMNWALNNPVNPALLPKDLSIPGTVGQIFSDPAVTARYNEWLDAIAEFFNGLVAADGKLVPVIFRPFHECTGNWFWWGGNQCTPAEYIQLFQYTVAGLKARGVHNLLYAFNTSSFADEAAFFARYPGDGFVDVLSADIYDVPASFKAYCDGLTSFAAARNKIAALAETGYENMPDASWFTGILWPAIQSSGLSYVLLWGNYSTAIDAYWSTWHGQIAEADFVTFSQNEKIVFLSGISKSIVYNY